ncbi:MAG: CBS domain-containing protein [Candidatus Hadarchaeum sp.]|jgi:CBS domain-containing protein|nr:CBS domain-containing protein [Candidatus Hadarchaeum sp.]
MEKDISLPLGKETLLKMKVKDVMNPKPRTIHPDTSIKGTIQRIRQQIEDCLPVVDAGGKLVGVVTESDILYALRIPSRESAVVSTMVRQAMKQVASNAGELMTKNPISVTPDMTIQETLSIMVEYKHRHLPVVGKDSTLVGLISLREIISLHSMVK